MRELKFRTWYEDRKIMLSFELSNIEQTNLGTHSISLGSLPMLGIIELPLNSLKFMQYLGKEAIDKNGNRICEDDIIMDERQILYRVMFFKHAFYVVNGERIFQPLEQYPLDLDHCKLMGNIYQNKELMRGQMVRKHLPKHIKALEAWK